MAGERSLRTRLLVWNTSVIVLILAGFAAATAAVTRAQLTEMFDRDLVERANNATRLGPPPPGSRPRIGFGAPEPGGPGFGGASSGPLGPGQPRPPGFGAPVPEVYRDANVLADIRRPRFVSPGDEASSLWGDTPFDDTRTGVTAPEFSEANGLRVLSVPVVRDGQRVGTVQVAQDTRLLATLTRAQGLTFAILLPAGVAFAFLGAWLLIERALKPVDQVTQAAARIGVENLSDRLPVTGNDELARMAGTFNELLERLDDAFKEKSAAYARLQGAYDAQQRFTADASHELRTPLTRMRLALGNALATPNDLAGLAEAAKKAERAAADMTRLVEDLLTLARTDAGVLTLDAKEIDLRTVVAEGMEAASLGEVPAVDGAFPDAPVLVVGDESLLRRVIINLVTNARRHTSPGGQVKVAVSKEPGWAIVSVSDTGEGIAEVDLPYIFDRFYRSGSSRSRQDGGTGLGLAITKGLVDAHEGRVEATSQIGQGSVFRVLLPLL